MPKRSIKAMRRDELVDAAIAIIGEDGLGKATLASIAGRAGMSAALVNHYFEGKDELLAATMRSLSNLLRRDILALLPLDPSPEQRLRAIVDGSFQPQHFTKGAREAWVQFLVHALHDEAFFHLHQVTGARFVANVRYAVRRLVEPERVEDVVDGLTALIDGFFWEFAIDRAEDDLLRARRICWDYACSMIPGLGK